MVSHPMRAVHLCCIVKNEAPYIEEFIEYHLLKGVRHFNIYDHGSTDNTRELIAPYERMGLCTIINWSIHPVPAQKLAYEHCLKRYKEDRKLRDIWLGFLDADEFAVVRDPKLLGEVFQELEGPHTAILAGNWILFGSSGHVIKPDGLVIENYTHSEAPFNQHVKCFCIPYRTLSSGNDAHTFLPEIGFTVQLADGRRGVEGWPFHGMTEENNPKFWIHHYHTKSEEEYRKRCERGRVDMIEKKDFETNFEHHDRNEYLNLSLEDYPDMIKAALKRRPWNLK